MPLAVLGRIPATVDTGFGAACFALAMLAFAGSISLIFVFTLCVYHWTSGRARLFVALMTMELAASAVGMGIANLRGTGLDEILPLVRPWAIGLVSGVQVCCAWGAVEAFIHYRKLRRRLALGLVDPVVANRFLVWGIATGTTIPLCVGITATLHAGMVVMRDLVPLTILTVAGSLMSVTWYLTFFAPARYQRWVRRRAALRFGS